MRIRNAAIAGATAIAVAFGGTTIASAQDEEGSAQAQSSQSSEETTEENTEDAQSSEGLSSEGDASLSSKIGDSELVDNGEDDNKNTEFAGKDVFGSSKNFENVPSWAKGFYALTIVASIGSLIGLVVGPAANYIQFGQ
ncbi:MAG TPA: hypothetical protein DHV38_02130 [Corynebacterium casei]|uniref:hypothetical protein n=2 Tax=Corynebacterium casei TaxID=160386 RepID=UPI000EDA0D71|nr:hypothetical protein [Corynebacterium casei]HCJ68226.1 hypothetical protein [Corynebacterium casei]